MDSWWETPLCSDFLRNIGDEIFSGKVVLAFLPNHTPKDFILELKSSFAQRDLKTFKRINLAECKLEESNPIENLIHVSYYLNELDRFVASRVVEIFSCPEVNTSNLIIIERLPKSLLGKFKIFLEEYSRFSTKKATNHRHKILVILDPNHFNASDFASEAGISKILYQGIFDKLDQSLALRYMMKLDTGNTTPFIENLITSLSQFDYTFSETLCEHKNLLDYCRDICFDHAKMNDWKEVKYIPANSLTEYEYWIRWAKGIAEKKNGEIIYHTAYLVMQERFLEVNKRIWQVGIEIILPMIENIRLKTLNCRKLNFPDFSKNNKTGEFINDKFKFEIGEILYLWQSYKIQFIGLSRFEKDQLLSFINLSKTLRDDLAHVKTPQACDITQFYNEYNKVDTILKS